MFFIPDFNGGGAERALCNLLGAWPRERRQLWNPVVVVRNPDGPLRALVPAWVEVHSLGLLSSGMSSSLGSVTKLARLMKRKRPSVVVSFLSLPSVALAVRLGWRDAHLVVSVQNPFQASKVGFVPNKGRSPLVGLATRLALRQVERFWVISPGIGAELRARFRVPGSHIAVLPNSVDLAEINASKDAEVDCAAFSDPGIPVLLSAGRLVHQKRGDVLMRATAALQRERPVNLVLLGEGPLRSDLERLATELGIRGRTSFLGYQSNPWRFMSKASVFVLASDFEGFGNVLVEAMACGVPVVSTRAPFGPEYVLAGGECGRLVPCGDAEAMAAAIASLLDDEESRRALVAKGHERAATFSLDKVAQTFWRLLLGVTSNADDGGGANGVARRHSQEQGRRRRAAS